MKPIALALAATFISLPLNAQDQPARPPITGIAHVRIYSTDLHKSLDFYSQILGMTPRNAGCTGMARPCFIVNDRQQIQLSEVGSASPANLLAEIAFATPDVVRMRNYLLARNVAADPVTRDISGVARCVLHDPEGNTIAFVQLHPRIVFTAPAEQISTRMLHAGFIVKDRAAEDRFYSDLLGFRMYWHGGFKDADNDWWEIQVPDGTDWIEHMLNISPTADKQERGVQNHFSLAVENIKPTVARLHAHGLKTTGEPEIGRDGKWSFDVYDPDLTRVEFMEFKPAQPPCCNPYTAPHPVQ